MVLEVPTVAPAMIGMAEVSVSIPAVMKPTVASTVALEACVATVIAMPAPKARAGRAVTRCSEARMRGPASDLSPSVRRVIPRRNSPTPPRSCAMVCQEVGAAACTRQEGRASEPTLQEGIQLKSFSSIGEPWRCAADMARNSPASK